ncbi:hypothetical protein CEE44_05295 [Candidatus Woesearchaeota archaeon B3_Woes]|nr:MAG: hypothetical protein CEE44_05295 [Candidatus Woesearchaeota archaeon B3_Woes]
MIQNIFITIGLIIIIGYLGRISYQKTKVPESIFLIVIGLLIGPVFGFIKVDVLLPIVPFVSILALMIVLLDCGLNFNVFKVLKRLGRSFLFTIMIGVLSTFFIGFILYSFFNWQLLHALLLGVIASGTTTVTAMTLINKLNVSYNTKHLIFLETVINDFTIIFGVSVILLINKQLVGGHILKSIFSSISIAVVLGFIIGYIWINILKKIELPRLNYISSVGALFLLYGLTELLNGEGLIAVLVFSLLIGNYPAIHKKFIGPKEVVYDPAKKIIKSIRSVQEDISFLVRVFFFVLIGAIFNLKNITNLILVIVGIVLLIIIFVRLISLNIVVKIDKTLKPYSFIIVTMIPRGFIATVLAFIPLKEQIVIPSLTEIVLLLVLSTNILAMIFSFIYSRFIVPRNPEIKEENA